MDDIDNLYFIPFYERDIELNILIDISKCFGAYCSKNDKMFFYFSPDLDFTWWTTLQWFVFVVDHEFTHRILTQFINRSTSREYDNIYKMLPTFDMYPEILNAMMRNLL